MTGLIIVKEGSVLKTVNSSPFGKPKLGRRKDSRKMYFKDTTFLGRGKTLQGT